MATYVLVDGENVDGVLAGMLGKVASSEERPRWDRVLDFAKAHSGEVQRALFFLNVTGREIPIAFAQALVAMGYVVVPLSGQGKVVDIAIERTLLALQHRQEDVLLLSHDGDFATAVAALLNRSRKVGVVGFLEFMSGQLRALAAQGLALFDLETDARVFLAEVRLPRLRVVLIEEFDPEQYL